MNGTGIQKTKLLIVIPSLECGGTEKFAMQVCEHINTDLFEVTLAVLNNAHPFYTLTNPVIKLVDLKARRVRTSLFAIRRTIREERPAIIFSLSNHLNLYMAIYRRQFPPQIKLVARESSIPSFTNKRSGYPYFYNYLMKKFYHRFDAIVCQSAYMQQDLVQHFGVPAAKTHIICNMAGDAALKALSAAPENDRSRVRKFITVARLSGEKGIDRLIKSVALLPFSVQYHIIGEGPMRSALEKLIIELGLQEKVFLPGRKGRPFEGLEDADLFLLDSDYEGFPNVLLEAGVLGIPVVARDAPGGINEIIRNGENGFLVSETGTASFAAAIEKALQYKFSRENIIALTKERFPTEKAISALEELFLTIGTA